MHRLKKKEDDVFAAQSFWRVPLFLYGSLKISHKSRNNRNNGPSRPVTAIANKLLPPTPERSSGGRLRCRLSSIDSCAHVASGIGHWLPGTSRYQTGATRLAPPEFFLKMTTPTECDLGSRVDARPRRSDIPALPKLRASHPPIWPRRDHPSRAGAFFAGTPRLRAG